MGFLDSLFGNNYAGSGDLITTRPTTGEFLGNRPGFDLGDIPDVLGRIFGTGQVNPLGLDLETFPAPFPGGLGQAGGEEGAVLRLLGLGGNGNGGGVARQGAGLGSSLYIGGSCPGLWHNTAVRTVYDRNTGEPRQVGGNERANPISIMQSASGALAFFAPVIPSGWRMKYKTRRARHHHHPAKRVRHHHHKRKRAHHHHRGMTAKQMRYFGTAAQRRAHASA